MDPKIVQVALSGLENILRAGGEAASNNGNNPYAVMIEECYGLDKIEFLQSHENMEIYQKAFDLIEKYFGSEDGEDASLAPRVAAGAGAGAAEYAFETPDALTQRFGLQDQL